MKSATAPPALSQASAGTAVVYWLPLESATAHFEATRGDLVAAVKRGELRSRRIFCGDDMAVALCSAELLERYSRRPEALAPKSKEPGAALISAEALRDQATELARVQAHLEAAERVERALQRYTDRLEAQLARSRREALTLARALGRAEQLAASTAAAPRRVIELQ